MRNHAWSVRTLVMAGAVSMVAAVVHCAGAAAEIPVGDCNGDGAVTVDELIVGVNIALGTEPLSTCPVFDVNGDKAVTIDELIQAVNAALGLSPQQFAFVIATDFQTGSFGTVSLAAPHTFTLVNPTRRVNSDAVARTFGGLVYVINRFGGDNIQVLDPMQNFATLLQCSTGAGSDPNDIAFVSRTKAYVALAARAQLLIVNPAAHADCSDFVRGSVDLAAFADSDGIPDMNQLAVIGDRVYVSLERLTNFVPTEPGLIVAIDTATDTVVNEITLTGEDPFGESKGLPVVNGALVVTEVGAFGVNDGGIERVDVAAGRAEGFFVTEADLGGDITDFVLVSDHLGYAVVSKPDFTNSLVAFDPQSRAITQTLLTGGNFSNIEVDDAGELFVADRSTSKPGVRIFRASDGIELTPNPIDLGLPPFDILFVP